MNCAIGLCFIRDQHANPPPDHHDRDCRGCRPAQAEYGLICARHRGRLARALIQAPDLVQHIRTELTPSNTPSDGQPTGHRAPPAPIRLDAVDDADQVYAAVAQLADVAADLLNLVGPKHPGAWRDAQGRIAGVTSQHATEATTLAAGWLHVRLDWLSAWPDIAEVFEDADTVTLASGRSYDTPAGAVRVIETASNRWPTASRARYIPAVTCPRCDTRGSLVYHPPSWAETTYAYAYDSVGKAHGKVPQTRGDVVLVECSRCAYLVPDDRHGWYARLVTDIEPDIEEPRAG